jgi:hypothetical protein
MWPAVNLEEVILNGTGTASKMVGVGRSGSGNAICRSMFR